MKYVLFYESADDVASKAPLHFEAHRPASGSSTPEASCWWSGCSADPQREGSMAIITTRKAAEAFAGDPFVLGGAVQSWSVRERNEVLTGPDGRRLSGPG